MNPILINKNSPRWIGFQYAILSFVLMIVGTMVLSLSFPDVFGFFFATQAQEILLSGTATLLAALLSSIILFSVFKKIRNVSIFRSSLAWFVAFHVSIMALMWFFAPNTYGSTALGNLIDSLSVSLASLAAFLAISWLYLRNRVGN